MKSSASLPSSTVVQNVTIESRLTSESTSFSFSSSSLDASSTRLRNTSPIAPFSESLEAPGPVAPSRPMTTKTKTTAVKNVSVSYAYDPLAHAAALSGLILNYVGVREWVNEGVFEFVSERMSE